MKKPLISDLYFNIISKKALFLLGILLFVVFVPIALHPNQPDEWWRNGGESGGDVIAEMEQELSQMNKNDPQYIEKKRSLMLTEYEWSHVDDLKRYMDNIVLIEDYGDLISLLCFCFVLFLHRRSAMEENKQGAVLFVWHSFVIGMTFGLLLILIQILFSWITGKIILDFEGFFRSIFFVHEDRIIEVSGWTYLLVTRGLSFITIAVFCAMGIFINIVCKSKWIRVLILIIFVPLYFYIAIASFGWVDYIIFYKYILYEYLWGDNELLEGGSFWLGLVVHLAWFLLFFFSSVWAANRKNASCKNSLV